MNIEYRSPTVPEYCRLRTLIGWWPTDEDATEAALSKALFSVVAVEQGVVVGTGRIVGDGGLYYYVQDLMVDPALQNSGLGRHLMMELMSYIEAHARPGSFVGLMAAKGLAKYYQRFGFQARDRDAPGMYRVIE